MVEREPVEVADRPAEPDLTAPDAPAGSPTPAAGPGAADRHWRLAHLPVVLGASVGLLLLATALGALLGGGIGAAGAAAGVGVVTVSYLASTLVIAWADSVNPALVLPFGVAMYVAKFSVLGVVMAGVAGRGWAGLEAFGWGVVAGVVAWTGANIWWIVTVHAVRTHRPPQA
ncbi:hypothetical protein [Plantactinospora sp. BC1]|uniref:hypothetical protein n=1 Tax=Plantactinospora sp. BC1 TaxID=2108470 RepID=UPI0035155AAF